VQWPLNVALCWSLLRHLHLNVLWSVLWSVLWLLLWHLDPNFTLLIVTLASGSGCTPIDNLNRYSDQYSDRYSGIWIRILLCWSLLWRLDLNVLWSVLWSVLWRLDLYVTLCWSLLRRLLNEAGVLAQESPCACAVVSREAALLSYWHASNHAHIAILKRVWHIGNGHYNRLLTSLHFSCILTRSVHCTVYGTLFTVCTVIL